MWWNFVARTGEEIAAAREAWQAELAGPPGPAAPGRFGTVPFGGRSRLRGPGARGPAACCRPRRCGPRGRTR